MQDIHEGGCLCGAVRFKTRGKLRELIFCHCSQCRKQTGLYYAATNVLDSDMEIEGSDEITWYRSSGEARRGFCRHCGSALFWKAEGLDYTSILAGAFEKPTALEPGYHIFCADQGDYYEIRDDLPRFAAARD
ncbi:GFA family protein [Sinorhizobium alkalisoli]|uniref:Aldehyde-activating protein n=1 Tax=Sinorhizobium alkalisoli TaxID=1752398 RepID=A0A1E3VCM7_9HYPH|nr:GFA family protein [Sinorhizobium alkalisoli]MCA1493546.1 GFA family protein [Ensifer sp. NBAIM29]MCG5478763.1 GFA family protein [Sinorhizobium alkalisoli]ODR91343.1 aldehyde-activating protein [Sinorhizobium alkalisoli]QFI66562.1 Gfa-like protein [Sinorhizobium alkalisoli]